MSARPSTNGQLYMVCGSDECTDVHSHYRAETQLCKPLVWPSLVFKLHCNSLCLWFSNEYAAGFNCYLEWMFNQDLNVQLDLIGMNVQLDLIKWICSWIYSNECAAGFVLLEAPVCLYTVHKYSVWVHVHVGRPHAHLKLYSLSIWYSL